MYGLPSAIKYTDSRSFSNLSNNNSVNIANISNIIPINNNVFRVISRTNSSSSSNLYDDTSISSSNYPNLPVINSIDSSGNYSNLLAKNNVFKVVNISSSNSSNLPSNKEISCINSRGNSSILPEKNNTFQVANINNNSSSNLPTENNAFQVIGINNSNGSSYLPINASCNNSSSPSNVREERSSDIPATQVLEEMYRILELDIPPVFTFRQEIITRNFFCSAGFMDKWYDTKEAFPSQEKAKEAAAQSLLKIIMASKEYEKYLQAQKKNRQANAGGISNFHINPATPETTKKKKKNNDGSSNTTSKFNQKSRRKGNKQSVMQTTEIQGLSKRRRRKLPKRFRKRERQFLSNQKAIEKQSARQAFLCPAPVSEQESKSKKVKFDDKILVFGKDVLPKSSNLKSGIMSQKNQSSSSQYNQTANGSETYQTLVSEFSEKACILASKLLNELCIISNISRPKYYFCNNGYGCYIAEILVGNIKCMSEQFFQYQEEAQEHVAERAFNTLYAKSDESIQLKIKKKISLVLIDRSSNVHTSSQECESQSYIPTFSNHSNSCIQMPTHVPADYHMRSASQPMFNISTMASAASANLFSAPNLGSVQQTHQDQIQTEFKSPTISLTVPQQINDESIEPPYILDKLVKKRGWGIVDYQCSKTLKGYKCTCYVRKLKFTSNPCTDKKSAENQAAKIALLALSEYSDNDI